MRRKRSITWARENQALSGLTDKPIRWLLDDAVKFVRREVRRGSRYDGIIIDPPKFGRGPKGEVWKLDEALPGVAPRLQEVAERPAAFRTLELLCDPSVGFKPVLRAGRDAWPTRRHAHGRRSRRVRIAAGKSGAVAGAVCSVECRLGLHAANSPLSRTNPLQPYGVRPAVCAGQRAPGLAGCRASNSAGSICSAFCCAWCLPARPRWRSIGSWIASSTPRIRAPRNAICRPGF